MTETEFKDLHLLSELNWDALDSLNKDNYCDTYNSGRETFVWGR